MRIEATHSGFIMPTKGTELAGAFDLYMPEAGETSSGPVQLIGLGFKTAIPPGYVALLLPRSSTGAKHGVELNNTCGVIDADYRGEWKAAITTKSGNQYKWEAGDRVLQFLIVPVPKIELELVNNLDTTDRGTGGFGSSGV